MDPRYSCPLSSTHSKQETEAREKREKEDWQRGRHEMPGVLPLASRHFPSYTGLSSGTSNREKGWKKNSHTTSLWGGRQDSPWKMLGSTLQEKDSTVWKEGAEMGKEKEALYRNS